MCLSHNGKDDVNYQQAGMFLVKLAFSLAQKLEEQCIFQNKKWISQDGPIYADILGYLFENSEAIHAMKYPWYLINLCREGLSSPRTSVYLGIQLISSSIERFLVNLYTSLSHAIFDRQHVRSPPQMIRDLLDCELLCSFLGTECIAILKTLMGHPTGVNIRNIVWHGFIQPVELHSSLYIFLIVLIASIGKLILCNPSVCVENLSATYRHFKSLDSRTVRASLPTPFKYQKNALVSLANPKTEDYYPFGNNLNAEREFISASQKVGHATCVDLLRCSYFSIPGRLEMWSKILTEFDEQEYYIFLVLLMPQLEHCLRRLYVVLNQLPCELLTAESTVHYTTLDLFLNKSLPDGRENEVVKRIGAGVLNALFDTLVHTHGPRVRDRISHGECGMGGIELALAQRMLCIAMDLAIVFLPAHFDTNQIILNGEDCLLKNYFREYCSCFHPKTLFQLALLKCEKQNKKLGSMFASLRSRSSQTDSDFEVCMRIRPTTIELENKCNRLCEHFKPTTGTADTPSATIFFTHAEVRSVNMLRKIVHNLSLSLSVLCCKLRTLSEAVWNEQASRRQLFSFAGLTDACPCFSAFFKTMMVALKQYYTVMVQHFKQNDAAMSHQFYLSQLQALQKILTLVQRQGKEIQKHNWKEATRYGEELIHFIEHESAQMLI